jgi:chorismate mutase
MTSPQKDGDSVKPADSPPGLHEARVEIDRIDAEIVRLLSVRLSTVMRAFQIKRAVGLNLRDEEREAEIIERAAERATELDLPKKQVRKIFKQILRISQKAQ